MLLTNQSARPVSLFEEWNSWGYYGLSFDVMYADGRQVRVGKELRPGRLNFPSVITLAPQASYVFDVTLGPEWRHSPRPAPHLGQGLTCRLRARYTIKPSPESKGMWTGTVLSPESTYRLWP